MISYTLFAFPKGPARLFLYGKMSHLFLKNTKPYAGLVLKERLVERKMGAGRSK